MRQVAEINPVVPPAGKPMIPWMALGAAAIFVLLMLGAGNQYLARFQRPYSFEARSEPTIEIVEAPIVIDILSKPAIRKQFGRSAIPNKKIGAGTRISQETLRSNAQEDRRKFSTAQWMQSNSPPGGMSAISSPHLKALSMPHHQQACIGCRQMQPCGRAPT